MHHSKFTKTAILLGASIAAMSLILTASRRDQLPQVGSTLTSAISQYRLASILYEHDAGVLNDVDLTVVGKPAAASVADSFRIDGGCGPPSATCYPPWTPLDVLPKRLRTVQPDSELPLPLKNAISKLLASKSTMCTAVTNRLGTSGVYYSIRLLCVNQQIGVAYYRDIQE